MLQLASDKHPYVPRRRSRAGRAEHRCPSRGGGRGSSCRPCTGWVPSRRSARSPCGTAGTSGRRCHQKTQRGTSSRTSWGGNRRRWALVPALVTSRLRHLPLSPLPKRLGCPQPWQQSELVYFLFLCLECLESHSSNTDMGNLLSQL